MLAWDLTTAICVITSLSILAFWAGRRMTAEISDAEISDAQSSERPLHVATIRSPALLFVIALLYCLAFSWMWAGKLSWARVLPFSGVVYWSNLMPILLGFTAGVACNTGGLRGWSKPLATCSLGLVAVAYLLIPISRPIIAPAAVDPVGQWKNDVCLQSHGSTCGAAAAATLLQFNGIASSEREMVRHCLTSEFGTDALGIYRGLKLGATKSPKYNARKVHIASRQPSDWISSQQLPNVALVQFDRRVLANQSTSQSTRWFMGHRGEGHAVVVLGYEDGNWIIGDPAVGRVSWSDKDFRRRFIGDALFLKAVGRN